MFDTSEIEEIDVVVENGLLRPERPLGLPENTRLVIAIKRVAPSPEAQKDAKRKLHEIRDRGVFRTGSVRWTRDQLHEHG